MIEAPVKAVEFRQYQHDAAEALYAALENPENRPVAAIPTGAGKTHIMGLFFQKYLKENPDHQLTVLSHTQDILEQDYNTLHQYFPAFDIGLYSAGLGSKETGQITVAGIQSAIKAPEKFRWTNLFMIDEAHSVNHKKAGSYRTLLDSSFGRITGMSATVFRSGHGYIYRGPTALFNNLACDYTSLTEFNKLVHEGYLCKLISVEPELHLDSKGVKKTADDYNIKALSKEHNKDDITKAAIKECLYYGKLRKKWLVFAIDIEHADQINKLLNEAGIDSKVLHSRMREDRGYVVDQFKHHKLRALVSVGMITTGFDAPNVDLIVMLRPTLSAVLHVQMLGRGLRVAPNKENCLVLDFAGNLSELGPINNVQVPNPKLKLINREPPTKTCPECRTITYPQAKVCESCGHVFEFKTRLSSQANEAPAMAGLGEKTTKWLKVDSVSYNRHSKIGSPDSIRVVYQCGIRIIHDWICPDHSGFAGRKAIHMLRVRGYMGPYSTNAVLKNCEQLKVPKSILVDFSDKYLSVVNAQF